MKLPPEEKLLRLIRGKGAKPSAAAGGQPAAAATRPAIGGLVAAVTGAWRRTLARPWSQLAVWVLGALVGLEALVLLGQAVWPLPEFEIPEPVALSDAELVPRTPPTELFPSLASSISRPLFITPIA